MDFKKNKITVILAILLIVAVGYIAVGKIAESRQETYNQYFNAGVQQGQLSALDAILTSINSEGFVQITVPISENQTGTLTLVPFQPEEQSEQPKTTTVRKASSK